MLKKIKRFIKQHRELVKASVLFGVAGMLIVLSAAFLWVANLEVPTLDGFEARSVSQSTKIYDRTGKVLLFDLHQDIRRTAVPLSDMSRHIKNATIAIEDSEFYNHSGIRISRTLKAIFDNITSGDLLGGQGGSTITQQVVKNTLLTHEKTIPRKIKEWILALKLEKILTKDEILELYLNEAPYGGNIYGVEEAAQYFFGKSATDITLAESAYLAALPQRPSYYSPFGGHIEELGQRKNLVLSQMLKNGFISEEEYDAALIEEVVFEKYAYENIKAAHFVFYIREYLEEKYGAETVYQTGLRVITTLDYDMQKAAEETIRDYAYDNEEKFNAENAALVALDPKTGHILAMVGSRDYFDEDIDGKYNVTTAHRQPGSTFKPIVYASAFEKGYTPETVLFDVATQFSTTCDPSDTTNSTPPCYAPVNYDDEFRGPMTMRQALAQSINIPAIKTLYLSGVKNVIENAHAMGITTLNDDPNHYGLPLVLGGGEVSLLDLTNTYATLAASGVYNRAVGILRVEDAAGTVLEEYKGQPVQAIDSQAARLVTDILSDNEARVPAYGQNNFLVFNRDVAGKTGTTNDFRDVWVIGYTPTLAVGTWAGNNDNSPIVKKVAGYVIAPMWRNFMDKALPLVPADSFTPPDPEENASALPAALRGVLFDADGAHSILARVQKDTPRNGAPTNPASDPQYSFWEYPVRLWASSHGVVEGTPLFDVPVPETGGAGTATQPVFRLTSPQANARYQSGQLLPLMVGFPSGAGISSVSYYFDDTFMGAATQVPYTVSIVPQKSAILRHTIRAVGTGFGGTYVSEVNFFVD